MTLSLRDSIESQLAFAPTEEQKAAIDTFVRFLTWRGGGALMVMRGSAGTGKTSLAGAVVRAMTLSGHPPTLLAPTGRSAKVLSRACGLPAYTIHRRIYRQTAEESNIFALDANRAAGTLFIVDEASMIGLSEEAGGGGAPSFGTGSLLNDLLRFVYSGADCRMMLIGDRAQLPPVGSVESPALLPSVLKRAMRSGTPLKAVIFECDLTAVARQDSMSGILSNATMIRGMIRRGALLPPKIRLEAFADVVVCPGEELIESLASSYSGVGQDGTIVITRSNFRAGIYNRGIRFKVLGLEESLTRGDQIMIVKNNYFWKPERGTFLANGDRAVVRRVRRCRSLYGFRFADLDLSFPDYDDMEMSVTAVTDTLLGEAPALTAEQTALLYNRVAEDYSFIAGKEERMRKVSSDIYLNAVEIKYSYAVTCHKAQGGQWRHVYIDQGFIRGVMPAASYLRWLYTAFTRARERLFLIAWPEALTDAGHGRSSRRDL